MKKFITLLLILMMMPMSIAVDQSDILEKQIEIRRASVNNLGTPLLISMEASIDYVNELGGATDTLETKKSGFESKLSELDDADTHDRIDTISVGLSGLLKEFNTEADSQIKLNGGNALVWLGKIAEAGKANQSDIDNAKNHYWNVKQENTLYVFDAYYSDLLEVKMFIQESGWDMEDINDQIDTINDLRSDLDRGLEIQKELEVLRVQAEIVVAVLELARVGGPGLEWAIAEPAVEGWIDVVENAIPRLEDLTQTLDDAGIDVETLEEILDEANGHLDSLKGAYDDANLVEAKKDLDLLGRDWQEFVEEFERILNSEDVTGQIEAQISGFLEALQEARTQMQQDVAGGFK